jgi:hypothetical protein
LEGFDPAQVSIRPVKLLVAAAATYSTCLQLFGISPSQDDEVAEQSAAAAAAATVEVTVICGHIFADCHVD